MTPSVDFETKCYENDWKFVFSDGFLEEMIERCQHQFAHRRVIINNVKNRKRVEDAACSAVARGAIDEFAFAEDHADSVLAAVGLTKKDFGRGYYYSISELVGIFLSKSEYLLHFASDSSMFPKQPKWIAPALTVMQTHPTALVANPVWNNCFFGAMAESHDKVDDFWVGYGFSDQCYLIRPTDFRQPIYGETHPASERFPDYGGESFEKRVDSFMRNNKRVRLTYRHASYDHRNFPKSGLKRLLRRLRPLKV
jgi:hypothetical protein